MATPRTFTVFVAHQQSGDDPNHARLAGLWAEECFRQGGIPAGTDVELEWVQPIGDRSAGWSVWGLAYPPPPPATQSAPVEPPE